MTTGVILSRLAVADQLIAAGKACVNQLLLSMYLCLCMSLSNWIMPSIASADPGRTKFILPINE